MGARNFFYFWNCKSLALVVKFWLLKQKFYATKKEAIVMDYNIDDKILQDLILQDLYANGEPRPWWEKKINSLELADSAKQVAFETRDIVLLKRAERVRDCGTYLEFMRDLESGRLRLLNAQFCKTPLCPMCNWRKSFKMAWQVSRVLDVVEALYPTYVPSFMTLTLRNCPAEELSGSLDILLKGWNEFERNRLVKRIIKGYFRAVEITYDGDKIIDERRYVKRKGYYDRQGIKPGDVNPNFDTFHPHIHVIILLDQSYFRGPDYLKTSEWMDLWQGAARLDYKPVGDIRMCKIEKGGGRRKAVAEVAKYALKDSDFLRGDDIEATNRLVGILSKAVYRRRFLAFGGVMKQIAKELEMEKPGEGDLVHIDDETMREDVATQIEAYRWNFGLQNYFRV
jgi:plasmid rolling circle replication initiator protein Rep